MPVPGGAYPLPFYTVLLIAGQFAAGIIEILKINFYFQYQYHLYNIAPI